MVSVEAVVNNLDEAIFLFDKKGRLVFINKAGEEFFGRSYKEIKQRRFRELFSDAKDIAMLIHKTIMEGRSFNCKEMEVDIGRTANIDLNLSPYYSEMPETSPGGNGAILCIRENLALTGREDYQFDSLLYLLGSIAHEIKNPLSGIKGAAQILRASAEGSENSEAEECVNLILKETDRLNSVLHSYLTMTRIPVFNELNIHEVVEHAMKVMVPAIEERKISVHKSYDPSLPNISGDESKLLQVFINLLKNAVEAMKKSKERVLNISTRPSDEYVLIYEKKGAGIMDAGTKKQRWVVVGIEDTGIGISKDDLVKIFMPFYTKKHGGSGLGLALSKKIIKDHGGIIKVKSRVGAGSTFSVFLPLQMQAKDKRKGYD